MSKFTELLSLIPKGFKNPELVLEGIVNQVKSEFGTLSEEDQAEIARRRLICNNCPLNSILAKTSQEYKNLVGVNYSTEIDTFHCSICSCPILTKTASLHSDCGLTRYNETHPDNIQQLKWTKFK